MDSEQTNYLRTIAANTAGQIAELGSVAYGVGVFVSMGMNFALGNGFGALLVCWLSWLNVGFVFGEFMRPVIEAANAAR